MKTSLRTLFVANALLGMSLSVFGAAKHAKKSAAPAAPPPAAAAAPAPAPAPAPFAAEINGTSVNVRGQANLTSERLGLLKKGDAVTVLDTIKPAKHKNDEPALWYKIALPTNCTAWVNSQFVDAAAGTVKVKRLHVRSGPGENFSVIGLMEKGAAVKSLQTKGEWVQIAPPADAYAFIAGEFVKKKDEAPAEVAAVAAPVAEAPKPPAPTPAPPTEIAATPAAPAPPTLPAPTPEQVAKPPAAPALPVEPAPAPAVVAAPAPVAPAPEPQPTNEPSLNVELRPTPSSVVVVEPPARRTVTREGMMRTTSHINYPSWYLLESLDTGKLINFLYTTNKTINLKALKDQRVMVKGEEGLDKRWPNTPVLTIDTIEPVQ